MAAPQAPVQLSAGAEHMHAILRMPQSEKKSKIWKPKNQLFCD